MPELWLMLVNSVSGENKTRAAHLARAPRQAGPWHYATAVSAAEIRERAESICRQSEEVVLSRRMAHIVAFDADDDAQQRSSSGHSIAYRLCGSREA